MLGPDLPVEVQTGLAWYYLLVTLLNIGAAFSWVYWSRGQKLLAFESYLVAASVGLYGLLGLAWVAKAPSSSLYLIGAVANGIALLVVLPASIYQKVRAATAWGLIAVAFQALGLVYAFKFPDVVLQDAGPDHVAVAGIVREAAVEFRKLTAEDLPRQMPLRIRTAYAKKSHELEEKLAAAGATASVLRGAPEIPLKVRDKIDELAGPVTFFFGSAFAFWAFFYFRHARVVRIQARILLPLVAALLCFGGLRLVKFLGGKAEPGKALAAVEPVLIAEEGKASVSATQQLPVKYELAISLIVFGGLFYLVDRFYREPIPAGGMRPKTWHVRVPFGLTDPAVIWGILAAVLLFFGFSMTDYDFRLIVAKPDNVPITMMIFSVGFFTWLYLRRAVINDQRLAQGLKPVEAEEVEKVLVWPDLVYTEFICMIVFTVILVLWSILLKAPLEAWANLTKTPNPSKAPWYFLGLQEMLVYYDPWLAGVVFPSLIIFGLMAIPFIDFNQRGNGYFTFVERKFSVVVFLFGFIVLWVLMVMLGTFLRGPGWNFFGPYQFWDEHLVRPLNNVDLSDFFWIHWVGMGKPTSWYVREIPGFVALLAYFLILPPLLGKTVFRSFFVRLGIARFGVFILLVMTMAALPLKMLLRWSFNLKYIVHIDEFFFNF